MPKQTHPADAADMAAILAAKEFTAKLFRGKGKWDEATSTSLAGIRAQAASLEKAAANGKKALVYAMLEGKAVPVPAEPKAGNGKAAPAKAKAKAAPKKAAKAKAKKAAPKKAAKGKAKAKAVKAPRETRKGSKTETVIAMLRKGKHTRADIVEATGWQVDLKALAARKGLRLKKDAEGVLSIAG